MTEDTDATRAAGAAMLRPGMQILVDGALMPLPEEFVAAFRPGDLLLSTGDSLVHVPKALRELAAAAVSQALTAFAQLSTVSDTAITAFYKHFAARLTDAAT